MRCPYRNDDYRKHWLAHRSALSRPQHDYDKCGPAYSCHLRARDRQAYAELIRYGAALGRARGLLPEDLSRFVAWGVRHDDGTGLVSFTPGEFMRDSYFSSKFIASGEPVHVRLQNLNWAPEPATEETEE
jgi:hypothetical protein